tara:strand:- start:1603 stop:2082 length:480 start_codon:yes stop_codon:yes gene_type:complete
MAEHDKEKTFLQKFGKEKFGEKLMNFNNPLAEGSDMPEPVPPTVNMPQMDSEEERFNKMVELNGKQYDNGERSQGDQEAEQRMVQNKKTGLLQKFVNMVTSPFSSALEKEFGTEEQPKYGGKDAVMYKGKFIHPDLYKMLMNRPDLEQRFTETGSIYGD